MDPHARDKINGPQAETTDKIFEALLELSKVRSHNYYVSTFDPNVHDFDVWCVEVDKAKHLNAWDDRECLGHVSNCLRGDAKTWLNDWVTTERTWSNLKVAFRSFCPQSIDIATVLFEVMCTNSNKFPT